MIRANIGAVFLLMIVTILIVLAVDRPLADIMQGLGKANAPFILWCKQITDFGKSIWLLPPCALAALIAWMRARRETDMGRRRQLLESARFFCYLLAAIALCGVIVDLLKILFGRTRPVLLDQQGLYEWVPFTDHARWASFPSGHATNVWALVFVVALRWPRIALGVLGAGAMLASTRWLVAAHYLADVLGAALLTAVLLHAFDFMVAKTPALQKIFSPARSPLIWDKSHSKKTG